MRGQERRALHLNFRFLAELENGEGEREGGRKALRHPSLQNGPGTFGVQRRCVLIK